MGNGTLTIYNASAGSGKTYRLTGIYLTSLFRSRFQYRKILAVTFTHKATSEMKSRILDNLNKLASGEASEYLPELVNELGKSDEWIRTEAGFILNSILHDFSRFSVSTIDSFFQKILRAFTRETGLHSGFTIELDHSAILSEAIDEMIAEASTDKRLKDWLSAFALANIDDEKSWNLKGSVQNLAEELFREKFKVIPAPARAKLEDKKALLVFAENVKSMIADFENNLFSLGKQADALITSYNLSDDMFYRKGQGVPRFIRLLSAGQVTGPNSYVRELKNEPPHWSTGKIHPLLQEAIDNGLEDIVIKAIDYYDDNFLLYNSACAVVSNIYSLGILSDILNKVHQITTNENTFLLSDAGEVLNLVTGGDQTPFIYEKVGNVFENFMIDEFQDTSAIQWNNFNPLINNSMAEGHDNLVVGDIKQSIYRWRNSDWKILGSVLKNQVDNIRIISRSLTTNWRCRSNIIRFNNRLFSVIPSMLDAGMSDNSGSEKYSDLYAEAVQIDPGKRPGGYVNFEFIEDEKEVRWQEKVLDRLPSVIEEVQSKGYFASDIGIIVRDGKEGAMVLKKLIDYRNSLIKEKLEKFNFNVVSNDSLLLSNSPVVHFIISVLYVADNPGDLINRAGVVRFFLLSKGDENADQAPINKDKLSGNNSESLPAGYEEHIKTLTQMPLFEVVENIIKFFNLGECSWNIPYLNSFQDLVLAFSGEKSPDLRSFLDWWEVAGNRKSVVLPGNQNAIRILTIHKSKGLEFRIVIVPFISWALDHTASKQPILWATPSISPFSDIGVIPVRYGKNLTDTIFSAEYFEEQHSVYLDNLNLLYVALTRARDALYGFSITNPRSENTVSTLLKNALASIDTGIQDGVQRLSDYYQSDSGKFKYGNLTVNEEVQTVTNDPVNASYEVTSEIESLKLKLHGENYFSRGREEVRKKINYGNLMHRVFEAVFTPEDIQAAVKRLVIEGVLPDEEASAISSRVAELVKGEIVKDWFSSGNKVLNEAGIILPSGNIRRPDRVIFRDGKTIIIDFKFGNAYPHYQTQVEQYGHLLLEMGYKNIEAYIWYVDKNYITPVDVRS